MERNICEVWLSELEQESVEIVPGQCWHVLRRNQFGLLQVGDGGPEVGQRRRFPLVEATVVRREVLPEPHRYESLPNVESACRYNLDKPTYLSNWTCSYLPVTRNSLSSN